MKDLKTALQDLAKAKGFNTDGLSEKELFQIVTGIQHPSDEMMNGEFASWYVPGGAAVEKEESETESTDETPDSDVKLTDKTTDDPDAKLTDKTTGDPDAELTDKTTDETGADTTPAKDVDSSNEPTDTTDETKNQSNSTVDVESNEN